MVKASVGQDLKAGLDCATFGVVRAVNQTGDTSLNHRASAHAARLDRDVQSGAGEAVVAQQSPGFAQNDDFGVCRGIAISDRAISRAREAFAVVYEDRADGYFASGRRATSFGESFMHELSVDVH